MSANIATIDNAPAIAIAYQGSTPWHALGTRMEGKPDVPAALEAAHLNWDVELKPLYFRNGDKLVKVAGRRAVVRSTDKALLSTVGGDYTPLQNSDAFGVLQTACEKFGLNIETAGALGKGDRVWMLAKMPTTIEPVAGDHIDGYVLVLTGHNGWTPHSARLTPTRVVCANTLSLAMRDQAFVKLRHTRNEVERIDQVAHLVTDMVASLKATGETFKKLAAKRLTEVEMREYVNRVLGISEDPNPVAARRRDTIIELATKTGKGIEAAPGTLWAVYNGLTEYVDHVRPAEAKAIRTIKQANESAIFGANMKVKVKALELAAKIAA